MVRELSTFPLLDGYRGAPPATSPRSRIVLRRVSALAADHPAIAELDCNPVLVGPAARRSSTCASASRPPAPRPADGVLGRA